MDKSDKTTLGGLFKGRNTNGGSGDRRVYPNVDADKVHGDCLGNTRP